MTRPWDECVLYEVYVRSFADGDGDGVGDLLGLRERLPVLAELGVDVVWLTPFYPSPRLDGGYDVADYLDVDERYGGLAAFDAVVADTHGLGMRLMIDLVPNHTSSRHPWFRSARSRRDAPHRDYYVWRDPAPDGGPPNNWRSHFGGPAWTHDPVTDQYWLHLFLPEQPDLNWTDRRVHDEFDAILRWWLGRGVDGFRVDVAHGLLKDPELRDNPLRGPVPDPLAPPRTAWGSYEHVHDLDQPDTPSVYRRWRAIADDHDAFLLGEVYLLEAERVVRYVGEEALHAALWIPSVKATWDAGAIRAALQAGTAAGEGRFVWFTSSHDDQRAASRFGGGAVGRQRALAYLTLLAGLPGPLLLYQGDEIGLEDGEIDLSRSDDPIAVRSGRVTGSRDPVRTPMLWEPTDGFGFTTGEPWLPFGADRTPDDTVEVQRADPSSIWNRTRDLLEARRRLTGGIRWIERGDGLVAYERGGMVVAANCGGTTFDLDVDDVVFRSGGHGSILAPGEAIIATTAST